MADIRATASDLAKKATQHAFHKRVPEAVYLYRLCLTFLNQIIESDATGQAASVLKDSVSRYTAYVEANKSALPEHLRSVPLPIQTTTTSTTTTKHTTEPTTTGPKTPPRDPPVSLLTSSLLQHHSSTQAETAPPAENNNNNTATEGSLASPRVTTLDTDNIPPPSSGSPFLPRSLSNLTSRVSPMVRRTTISNPVSPTGAGVSTSPLSLSPGGVASSSPISVAAAAAAITAQLRRSDPGSLPGSPSSYPGLTPQLFTPPSSSASPRGVRSPQQSSSSSPFGSPEGVSALLQKVDDAKKAGNMQEAIKLLELLVDQLSHNSNSKFTQLVPPPPASQSHRKQVSEASKLVPVPIATDSTGLVPVLPIRHFSVSHIDLEEDEIQLHERLGGGGSGASVIRCTCRGLTFAAKVLPACVPTVVRDSVLGEIFVMTKLDHPNVAKYLGHDLSNPEKILLFMEMYTNKLSTVLKQRSDARKWLSRNEVLDWAFQIAKGLSYLHNLDQPIIHRDLKSDNVFAVCDVSGRVQTLKIADFDTAKITEACKVTYTKNLGTVGYMAPEVCGNPDKGYTDKADIWSFGMVMYEMIQLNVPYYQVPVFQRFDMQQKGIQPTFDIGERAEQLKDVIAIFEKCTQKNPDKRPTAKKLVTKLAALM